jgi:hypothetical protein
MNHSFTKYRAVLATVPAALLVSAGSADAQLLSPVGDGFVVDPSVSFSGAPTIAANSAGDYVVAFESTEGLRAGVFESDGTVSTSPFTVAGTSSFFTPADLSLNDSAFTITYTGNGSRVQQFALDGTLRWGERSVLGSGIKPRVGLLDNGISIVATSQEMQNPSGPPNFETRFTQFGSSGQTQAIEVLSDAGPGAGVIRLQDNQVVATFGQSFSDLQFERASTVATLGKSSSNPRTDINVFDFSDMASNDLGRVALLAASTGKIEIYDSNDMLIAEVDTEADSFRSAIDINDSGDVIITYIDQPLSQPASLFAQLISGTGELLGTPMLVSEDVQSFADNAPKVAFVTDFEAVVVWDNGSQAEARRLEIIDQQPGDANGDGTVDLSDFTILRNNFGTAMGATLSDGDFNGDGMIDLADFTILRNNFGTMSDRESSDIDAWYAAIIPEPTTAGLLGAAGLLGLLRRRR